MKPDIKWWWDSGDWSPYDLGSKLLVWLDASDASTIIVDGGNNVERWNDKAGNFDFEQLTAAAKPVWDGINKITFDGIDDKLTIKNLATFTTLHETWEFWRVGKAIVNGHWRPFIGFKGIFQFNDYHASVNQLRFKLSDTVLQPYPLWIETLHAVDETVVEVKNTTVFSRRNGGAKTIYTTIPVNTDIPAGNWTSGSISNAITNAFINSVIWTELLTEPEKNKLRSYLKTLYSVY